MGLPELHNDQKSTTKVTLKLAHTALALYFMSSEVVQNLCVKNRKKCELQFAKNRDIHHWPPWRVHARSSGQIWKQIVLLSFSQTIVLSWIRLTWFSNLSVVWCWSVPEICMNSEDCRMDYIHDASHLLAFILFAHHCDFCVPWKHESPIISK